MFVNAFGNGRLIYRSSKTSVKVFWFREEKLVMFLNRYVLERFATGYIWFLVLATGTSYFDVTTLVRYVGFLVPFVLASLGVYSSAINVLA